MLKKIKSNHLQKMGLFGACTPTGDIIDCVQSISKDLYSLILGGVIIYSIFMLPYIGYLMASGDTENVKKGKEFFTAWITGLMLIVFSGLIVRVIAKDLLGVN